jgi:hypothetical protein
MNAIEEVLEEVRCLRKELKSHREAAGDDLELDGAPAEESGTSLLPVLLGLIVIAIIGWVLFAVSLIK